MRLIFKHSGHCFAKCLITHVYIQKACVIRDGNLVWLGAVISMCSWGRRFNSSLFSSTIVSALVGKLFLKVVVSDENLWAKFWNNCSQHAAKVSTAADTKKSTFIPYDVDNSTAKVPYRKTSTGKQVNTWRMETDSLNMLMNQVGPPNLILTM